MIEKLFYGFQKAFYGAAEDKKIYYTVT